MTKLRGRFPGMKEWDQTSLPPGTLEAINARLGSRAQGVDRQMIFEYEGMVLYGAPLDLEVILVDTTCKACSICGQETPQCCSDCRIDLNSNVYVCSRASCMDEHEDTRCTLGFNPCPDGWNLDFDLIEAWDDGRHLYRRILLSPDAADMDSDEPLERAFPKTLDDAVRAERAKRPEQLPLMVCHNDRDVYAVHWYESSGLGFKLVSSGPWCKRADEALRRS